MAEGEQLKYGQIHGGHLVVEVSMAASQVIGNASGHFCYLNAGSATLCLDAVAYIFGWIEGGAETPSSGDVLGCNIALDAIYRIPVNSGTYAAGMLADLTDLSISSNIQGVQLGASVENLVILTGGDATNNNWVDVKINPAVQGASVGADA